MKGYFELLFNLVVLAVLLAVWLIASYWSCTSRWSASGMPTSWGPVQGCLVRTPAGRWVPEDRVSDIDLSAPAAPAAAPIPTR